MNYALYHIQLQNATSNLPAQPAVSALEHRNTKVRA